MMEDRLVTYKTACLAKEKGFPQSAMMYYEWDGFFETLTLRPAVDYLTARYPEPFTAAPTQSLLQRWLREEKGVTICVDIFDDGWFFDISTFYKQDTGVYEVDIPYMSSNASPVYDTYELALEDALKYALEKLV